MIKKIIMDAEKKQIKLKIKSQKILLSMSFLTLIYIIYFGIENPKWQYYCAVAGAYLFTKGGIYAVKLYRNIKLLNQTTEQTTNEAS